MSTRQSTTITVVLVLILAGIVGCQRASHPGFWQVGERYDIHLHVDKRLVPYPGIPVPPMDSLHALVTIDRAARDSLYGRCECPLDSIGVFTTDDRDPLLVAVRVSADSFTLVLAFQVIDAEVALSGSVRDGVGTGTWRQLSPGTPTGRFEVRRISP